MAETPPSEIAGAKSAAPFAVLVVDGNEEHQILSVAALTRRRWVVRTAASGKQGLQLAMSQHFDAVVLGSKLRDATGLEVLHILAERFPDVPKIFVVPPEGEDAALRAMESGAHSYIVKTPRYTELLPAVVEEQIEEARNRTRLAETRKEQAQEVMEREAVEERLSQTETRLRMILQRAPVMLWSTDKELRVMSARGGGFRTLDASRSRERGLTLFEYFDVADEGVEPIASHRRALAGESVATQVEWQGRAYEVHIEPFRSPENVIIGTIGVAFDVTERRKAEAALQESNEALLALFNASPVAIVSLDREAKVRSWNPAAERLFGWKASEIFGRTLPTVPSPADGESQQLEEVVLAGRNLSGMETRRLRKDGTRVDVSVSAAPLRDAHGEIRGLMAVMEELGARKTIERQLVEAARLATMGQLAGFIAHELNTPLTNISLLTSAIAHRVSDETVLEKLQKISGERRRAAKIIRGLMSFSRNRKISRVETDLRSVVIAAVENLRRRPKKGVTLDVQTGDSPISATVDPLQLEEVVVHLLKNALDATSTGSVRVRLEERTQSCAIVVSDTGTGMTPEVLSHLYEPFFTTRPRGEGTGLGLLLSKQIVAGHGGTIEVSSETGDGSTFTVLLPRGDVR